jgi:hypothetical protein
MTGVTIYWNECKGFPVIAKGTASDTSRLVEEGPYEILVGLTKV